MRSILVALALLTCAVIAEAQKGKKIPRIGHVSGGLDVTAFWGGLHELGYLKGENIVVEYRDSQGRLDLIPAFVTELVQKPVDLILATNNVSIDAARRATRSIPIVMVTTLDPVAAGYVQSLARPGGNLTGFTTLSRELSAKRIELLKEIFPKLSRVAVLWDSDGPGPKIAFKEYQAAALAFKLRLQSVDVHGPKPDFTRAFQEMRKAHADVLIVVANPLITQHRELILDLARKNRIPTMTEGSRSVEAGSLLSYGPNIAPLLRRAALYVDRILKGTAPADLPVEQPTKFEFAVNLQIANEIGVTIPQWPLMKADRVIR
jgi:putative tryptophan/tyrosine transport system substrate-binding protein